MRKKFIVEQIFAESLIFVIISSTGYPYSGFQTNALNASNDFLTSSSPSYTTVSSANHPSDATNLDKIQLNDSSNLKTSTQFDKGGYTSNRMEKVYMTDESKKYTTGASVIKETVGSVILDRSIDIALRVKLSTTTSSFQILSSTAKSPGNKLENKSVLPKLQKTDAPMLNYIFDMFSTANKHHHHDQRYGPHFEDIPKEGNRSNITVQAGASIYLNCRISLLQDKTVSWVRRNSMGEDALELLTVGLHTYTGDKRYTMEFQYPNNWRLKITNARKEDEGTYECQISTHPPRVIQVHLHVNAPKVVIVDEYNISLQEKYYEIDSTLQLSCIVRNVVMTSSVVFWRHGDQILNYDTTRGGVSVRTDLMDDGANSSLSIARVNKQDSGNYTCSISDSQDYSIMVHILKGESFAELHHGTGTHICGHYVITLLIIPLVLVLSQTRNTFR